MSHLRLVWLLFALAVLAIITHPLWVHGAATRDDMPTVQLYRANGYVFMSDADFIVFAQRIAAADERLKKCTPL